MGQRLEGSHSNQRSEMILRTRHNYFFNRITPTAWNALPKRIVQAPTLNMFKKGLDHRFKGEGLYS